MSNPKRVRDSPVSVDGDDKRACMSNSQSDISFTGSDTHTDTDPEATILTTSRDFLSSTVVGTEMSAMPTSSLTNFVDVLKAALSDASVQKLIAKAVTEEFKREHEVLKKEVRDLSKEVASKDHEITILKERLDDLEQYSRRNCIRLSNVPEKLGEDTDQLVCAVAKAAGVTLPPEAIERSHRIGRTGHAAGSESASQSLTKAPRQIIVKLGSYRHREGLLRARKNLSSVDVAKTFPDLDWTQVPVPPPRSPRSKPFTPRIYLNEDLTRERGKIATAARELKKGERVTDTWTRDGVIFIKRRDSSVIKVTTFRQLSSYFG